MRSLHNIQIEKNVFSAHVLAEKYKWEDFNFRNKISKNDKLSAQPSSNVGVDEIGYLKEHMVPEKNIENKISQVELEKVEKDAFDSGFADGKKIGFDEGLERATQNLQPHISLFEKLVKELLQEKESFYEENEFYIVKLAIEIAKKIIQRELTQNPEILLYVVREALKRIADNGRIVIRTNPEDLELIKGDKDLMQNHLLVFEHVDFVSSEKIQRGGCVIESESGIVDAQMDVQLEKIEQSLLEGVNG